MRRWLWCLALAQIVASQPPAEFTVTYPEIFTSTALEGFFDAFLGAEVSSRVGYSVHFHRNAIRGVIVVRAEDDRLKSIHDIPGKIVVAGEFWGLPSFQLQANMLEAEGINLLNDASQVMFMSAFSERPLDVLLNGDADVAFTEDFFLYTHPQFSALRLLHVYPGSVTPDHPYPASTAFTSQMIFAALPSVPDDVVEATRRALVDFNASRFPTVDFVDGFVPERSSTRIRSTMQEQRLIRFDRNTHLPVSSTHAAEEEAVGEEEQVVQLAAREGWRCFDHGFDLYEWITCPAGQLKLPPYRLEQDCAAKGLPCHPEAEGCVCQPCITAKDLSVASLSGTQPHACSKSGLCGETEQRAGIAFVAVDNLLRDSAELSFRVRDAEHILVAGHATPMGNHTFRFGWNVSRAGSVTMELYVDGVEADNSPVWVKVNPRTCDKKLEQANEDGICKCTLRALRLNGQCIELGVILFPIVSAVTISAVLCIVLYYRRAIRRSNEELWLIDKARVIIAEPPEVLGYGAFGEVIKASYQGTEVAVKRVLRNKQDRTQHPRTQPAAVPNGVSEGRPGQRERRLSAFRSADTRHRFASNLSAASADDNPNASSLPGASPLRHVPAPPLGVNAGPAAAASLGEGAEPGGELMPVVQSEVEISVDAGTAFGSREESQLVVARTSSTGSAATPRGGVSRSKDTPVGVAREKSAPGLMGGLLVGMRTPSVQSSQGMENSSEGGSRSTENGLGLHRSPMGMEEEIRLLASLRHPNITTLMGAIKDKNEYMMVMEFMLYGSLFDLYSNDSLELEGEILHPILLDVVSGMVFLHSADPPIVHGDLKSSNILVDEKLRAKIADFGFANSKPQRGEGSLLWLAPEMLRGGASSRSGDAYAFGVLLSEVLTRRLPYEGEDLKGVLQEVADDSVRRRPTIPDSCPPMIQVVMQACWESDPARRLSFESMRGMLSTVQIQDYPSKPKPMHTGDAMVYDMFPRHVADAIMKGETVPEDRRECATVFFSDICGFTNISAGLETHQVSAMLDRLFSAMDVVAAKHGIYKVETIGDCYIGVSNLVSDQSADHVSRVAAFSLDAMAAARRTLVDSDDASKGAIQIRAGFDSGPIVGSVVGTTYKKYTVFGNTVNTASRMESTGVPGRIQCTERAADLLEKEQSGMGALFELEERGEVHVKGRGPMTTFFVNEICSQDE